MRSVKVNTKNGEVTIYEGENVSLIVEGIDNLITGEVESIYGRIIKLIGDNEYYDASEISQVIK